MLGGLGVLLLAVGTNIDINGPLSLATFGSDATNAAFVLIAAAPAALIARWLLRAPDHQPRGMRVRSTATLIGIVLGVMVVEVFVLYVAWFLIMLPIACAHGC